MGQIVTKMTGSADQLLAEYQKVYQANIKFQEQMARGASQSRKHHNEVLGHISHEVNSLKSMALGYLSIHKVVDGLSDAYRAGIGTTARPMKPIVKSTPSWCGRSPWPATRPMPRNWKRD